MVSMTETRASGSQATDLAGKAIVITGGTTGIGRATAKLLAEEGARILIFGRHQPELDEAISDAKGSRGEVHGLVADQSRNDEIQRVFAEADKHIGGCDILINNAAVGLGSFLETKYEDWLYEIQTNLVAYIACCRYAIDRMRPRGAGHIVNIGSMSADLREPNNDVYVATKAGIQGFTESLRKNVNKENIRVTLIEPGAVATELPTHITHKATRQGVEQLYSQVTVTAEDIAEVIAFAVNRPRHLAINEILLRPASQER